MGENHHQLAYWSKINAIVQFCALSIAFSLHQYWPILVSIPFSFSVLFYSNKEVWIEKGFPGGAANWVTLIRLILCCVLLISASFNFPWLLVGLGLTIAILDGVDGYLARKEKKTDQFGNYFDMETDAVFVMCLSFSIWYMGIAGPWILLAGYWRYIFAISLYWINIKKKPEPRIWLARAIAVYTMIALTVAFVLPATEAKLLCFSVVGLLTLSFGLSYWDMFKVNGYRFQLKKGSRSTAFFFWFGLFALQFALFGISFLGNIEDASLFPRLQEGDVRGWKNLFYRINLDPFRFVLDIFLLTLIAIGLNRLTKRVWPSVLVFSLTYFILLFYTGYEAVVFRLFRSKPNFLSDIYIGIDVLPVFSKQFRLGNPVYVILGVIGLICIFSFGFLFIRSFVRAAINLSWNKREKIAFGGFALLILFGWLLMINHQDDFSFFREDQLSTRFITYDIAVNTNHSFELIAEVEELKKVDWDAYQYPAEPMKEKPNIYLIFLESYGTVLSTDERFQNDFKFRMDAFEERMSYWGWNYVSHWSEAPVKGGRSWLSFTSVLTGIEIKDHFVYSYLFNSGEPIPMMAKNFNQQGYGTYRITSLGSNDDRIDIPYEQMDKFFGFEIWLLAEDLEYTGGFWGGVHAVPDQYALHYLEENYLQKDDRPTFSFFITTASHWPWSDQQPPYLFDWRQLNSTVNRREGEQDMSLGHSDENYWNAMLYQIDMMEGFLRFYDHDNSVFVFLGDHQPPYLSDDNTLGTTYVHVFAKDSTLLQDALDMGFKPGLGLEYREDHLKHHELFGITEWFR